MRAVDGDGRYAAFKTPHTESMSRQQMLAYYLERAEAGYPSYQYFASQEICASDDYPDRQVQALKWLLIASVLHPIGSHRRLEPISRRTNRCGLGSFWRRSARTRPLQMDPE